MQKTSRLCHELALLAGLFFGGGLTNYWFPLGLIPVTTEMLGCSPLYTFFRMNTRFKVGTSKVEQRRITL